MWLVTCARKQEFSVRVWSLTMYRCEFSVAIARELTSVPKDNCPCQYSPVNCPLGKLPSG